MNLFVVGWDGSNEERARATSALQAMHTAFPLLDPRTLATWHGERGFAAWMHVGAEAAGPRRYHHQSADRLTLYDGTAVDPRGHVAGHDASSLASHWSTLTDHLEGRYAAVSLDERGGTLEVVNDPFGLHPTFVYRSGDAWWIANSVRLLVGVADRNALDLVGLARCLGMSWPGGDRTLVEGIAAMPAAQRWRWSTNEPLRRTTYLPIVDLVATPKRSFGPRQALDLAGAMGDVLEVLSASFAPLECPITAGRDSRMLAGLMVARELQGRYHSAGDPESLDVRLGRLVAERLSLPHRRTGGTGTEVAAAWDDLSRRVVQQLDGLVTLAHARNALVRPGRLEHVPVQLYGAAGELGRGKRFTPEFVLRRTTLEHATELARRAFDRGRSLVRRETREAVYEHVERTCQALHERGVDVVDVPDAFDLTEYGRRWAGSQARQITDHKDVVLPFFTRAYMRAAFATPPQERLMERLPYQLLKHLSPQLHALPFQQPWPPQHLAAFLLARGPTRLVQRVMRRLRRSRGLEAGRAKDRHITFERLRAAWRERYLDRTDSSVWQVVDRDRFEYLTSDRATSAERVGSQAVVYQAVTALAYEEDLEQWIRERRASDHQAARAALAPQRRRVTVGHTTAHPEISRQP